MATPPLFLVQITSDLGDDEYTWIEVYADSTGTLVELVGGRRGTAQNPGVDVLSIGFEEDDYALCRSAAGNAGLTWELYPIKPTPASIAVQEVDGTPSYTGATTLRFDQADGFIVSNPSTGVVRVDLATATGTQVGVVSTSAQTFGGFKTFANGLTASSLESTSTLTVASVATIGGSLYVHGGQVIVDGTGTSSPGGGLIGFSWSGGAQHSSIYAMNGGADSDFYLVTGDGSGPVGNLFIKNINASGGITVGAYGDTHAVTVSVVDARTKYRCAGVDGVSGYLGDGSAVIGGIVGLLGSGGSVIDGGTW